MQPEGTWQGSPAELGVASSGRGLLGLLGCGAGPGGIVACPVVTRASGGTTQEGRRDQQDSQPGARLLRG